jgi:uncharacterized protein
MYINLILIRREPVNNYTNNQQAVINKTLDFVKETLLGEGSGHDYWHVYRVWNTAKSLAKSEDCNNYIVELGALLHDIADHKFHGGDLTVGPRVAREFLEKLAVAHEDICAVCEIIATISFKGAKVELKMSTIEGMIVQDADRLDAIGAIGIARTFAYGGHKGHEMHNPEIKPQLHDSFDAYKNSKGTTVNHFYEKLLLLKDLMNTKTAKMIAEKKHKYMEEFLNQFYDEWNGIL